MEDGFSDVKTGEKTVPFWMKEAPEVEGERLDGEQTFDVCIIGAGISGLTTAYLLQREAGARKICVVDAYAVGSGQTGRTTAHIASALDDRYFELEKYHGREGARIAAESHSAAIDTIERICREAKIDCGFQRVDGYLFRSPESEKDILEKELAAIHRAGLTDVHLTQDLGGHPLIEGEPQALRFPRQAQFQPMKYLRGLADAFVRDGGSLFTNAKVEGIETGETCEITFASGAKIRASHLVVATNSPVNDTVVIHTKQAPYRSYVVGIEVPEDFPQALYWDTQDPYHYIRVAAPGVLIVGGEDHKTGQDDRPEEAFAHLEQWIRGRIPAAGQVVSRWSGQVMEPVDGMGFIGHNPLDKKNVYVITGDSGNGMTHGTIGGILVTDQICGRKNPWEALYAPNRKSIRAGLEFAKENANVALQYLDWFSPHATSESEISPGEGAVVRDGGQLIATYKDESGQVTKCSAVCPHLAGIVSWNSAERTWDCPCHGSRFAIDGRVIEGPALHGLKKIEVPAEEEATV